VHRDKEILSNWRSESFGFLGFDHSHRYLDNFALCRGGKAEEALSRLRELASGYFNASMNWLADVSGLRSFIISDDPGCAGQFPHT
jgi:hypothetical protein